MNRDACPNCFEPGVEVTTFTDWYHQWMCAACGAEWRGVLIDANERRARMSRWQEGLVQGLVFGSLGTSFGFGFAAWMANRSRRR